MAGLHELDTNTALATKMDALTRKLDLLMSKSPGVIPSSRYMLFCETCGEGHGVAQCMIVSSAIAPMEQAYFVGEDQRNQCNLYNSAYKDSS